jgi:ribosomal protein S18 acetylase RimI-like enzyme
MCRTRRIRYVCYVMTIGVIDEVRKLGIGSNLLQAMADCVILQERAIEALYLHVVIYNSQALAFYAKNDFKRIGQLKNWYEIQGKNYDAVLLYKPIRRQDCGIREAEN